MTIKHEKAWENPEICVFYFPLYRKAWKYAKPEHSHSKPVFPLTEVLTEPNFTKSLVFAPLQVLEQFNFLKILLVEAYFYLSIHWTSKILQRSENNYTNVGIHYSYHFMNITKLYDFDTSLTMKGLMLLGVFVGRFLGVCVFGKQSLFLCKDSANLWTCFDTRCTHDTI